MLRLFRNICIYAILIIIALELIIRVFHLTKDYPTRYVDEYKVEKWLPNQEGYAVTGNRRMNFSEYHINNSGYNSYREFQPTKEKLELALVGDSFIEGFHQNYYNSIGKKIENSLPDIEVYEYGYGGYDLADQLHLVHAYKKQFDLIDFIVFGLKFENDLTRSEYKVVEERLKLESSFYRNIRKFKLLVFIQKTGVLTSIRNTLNNFKNFRRKSSPHVKVGDNSVNLKDKENEFIENFKKLIDTYGFDKTRSCFLLNASKTPKQFLDYLKANNYNYIDFSELNNTNRPTTLIYDRHWNNYGRTLISKLIIDYLQKRNYSSNL